MALVDDDGKTKLRFFVGDIFYNNKLGLGDGERGFRKFDTTLQWIDSPRRGWTFFFHSFQPFCPEYADDWFGYRDLYQGKDQSFAFKPRTAAHVPGRLENNEVIYDDAFGTGIDLIIRITNHTMQKLVRIREGFYPAVDTDFDFILKFPEGVGVYEMTETKQLNVVDPLSPKTLGARSQIYIGTDKADGQDWYTRVLPVRIWDSGTITGPNTGQKQALTPAAIAVVGGATVLRKRVLASFFVGAVGDVYTDATVSYENSADTYYGSAFNPGPNDTSTTLGFGGWGDIYHSYHKFDDLTTGRYLRSDQVSAATFNVYTAVGSVNDAVVQMRRVTSSWDVTTLTRTNRPTENTTNRGSLSSTVGSGWKTATITTLVQEWLDGTSSNFGVKAHSTVGSNQNNGSFDSMENVSGNAPYIEITLVDQAYTRGAKSAVPTDIKALATAYDGTDKTNVGTDDGTRVSLAGTGVLLHLYKYRHSNNTDAITLNWNGQSETAPSSKTVRLQIYNFNTPGWEDVDTDNATAANTDFDLTGTISTNIDRYYDDNNYVYARVYQSLI